MADHATYRDRWRSRHVARENPRGTAVKYLFLHGLIAFPSDWDPVIDVLAQSDEHHCQAPAIPYMTGSISDPAGLADAIEDGLPSGYLEDSIIVGHSIGCTLALCMAEKARHAFLLAPHSRFRSYALPRKEKDMRGELDGLVYDPSQFSEEMRRSHMDLWAGMLKSRERIQHLKRLKTSLMKFDHEAAYDRYAEKISFILGKQDAVSPLEDFSHLKGREAPMRIYEIDSCCHAIPLEHPKTVAELLAAQRVRRAAVARRLDQDARALAG